MSGPPREHLAIVKPVYARKILSGEKTIECRITKVRCAPFVRVSGGDVIWIKAVSGRVVARCVASEVLTLAGIDGQTLDEIRLQHGGQICAPSEAWEALRGKRYATLVWLADVEEVGEGEGLDWREHVTAGSRAGWVVLRAEDARSPAPGAGGA